jgi:aryl-alcohol dehydrogenase-like predicted oxidoreductase
MLIQGRGFERSASGMAWDPGVVAVACTSHHPAVTAAMVGERRLDQIEGTIAAVSFLLSESEYQQLRNFAETIAA